MPLTDDERVWAETKISAGANPQDVFDTIMAHRDQYGPQTGQLDPEDIAKKNAAEVQNLKSVAGSTIVGGAALAGGLPLASAGFIPELLGSTLGAGGGELLRQKLFGEPTDLRRAGITAGFNAGAGLAGKAAVEAYGALGGIAPQYTRYVGSQGPVRGFGLTMREPANEAELSLARQIGQSIPSDITQPRQQLMGMIAQHDSAGRLINPQPVIDALEAAKVPNPVFPEVKAMNDSIDDRILALYGQQYKGGMKAVDLDSLINKELDPTAFNKAGDVASSKLAAPYAKARDAAKDTLVSALGPEAGTLRAQIEDELTFRELAHKYFGPRVSGGAAVSNIRNIEAPGREEAKQALDFVSQQSGIDFKKMAMDLATQRAYTADDRVKLSILNRIMLTLGSVGVLSGRPGASAATLMATPVVARIVSKFIAPLQGVAGPGGASVYEYLRSQYEYRQRPQDNSQASGVILKKQADRADVLNRLQGMAQ